MCNKPTRSDFSPQAEASVHLERAAFHLYEAGRLESPDQPAWDDPIESAHRLDARYRATGALRRGLDTCRIVVVERVAASLAVLDGDRWPQCDRNVNDKMDPRQRAALAAGKRQRYRHVARHIVAEVSAYYEMGNDDEAMRAASVNAAMNQTLTDRDVVASWRNRAMPSQVSQIRKDVKS
jgi:hypothetical protein